MNDAKYLSEIIGSNWPEILEHLEDAVIVMDHERQLRFANGTARRLLGLKDGEKVGGRCRKTMQGVDCEVACPLTFALDQGEAVVRDFQTVYTSRDGSALPLRVTVLPLHNDDGSFSGAVEILRPIEPEVGFLLVGKRAEVGRLRERLTELSILSEDLILVGEKTARLDGARSLHRMSGLDEGLFRQWNGSWTDFPVWPPGMVYADGEFASGLLEGPAPEGWRRVVGVNRLDGLPPEADRIAEVVVLPDVDQLREDLPAVLAAWIRQLKPGIKISAEALQKLTLSALEGGFDGVAKSLSLAVAAADGRLEADHIPGAAPETLFMDRLLLESDPLAALEKRLLLEVLDRSEWRMQEASDRLGMSRVTLWRKLKDHGIQRPGNGD
ncbi:MAG: PAS domain-containing protein [Thermoanaerobaculales bacterium]|nr:PAS domain-containing protein [Thermoanaerobaculales bacterium]